jgi:hypothetical protein
MDLQAIDELLETEKNVNRSDSWNKLNKTVKIQKLHSFAERFGREEGLPMKEVHHLKKFFNESLEKNKLLKTKEVVYDKETGEIGSIPALSFNPDKKNFTLRNLDTKRVSTLKSLTPKRMSTESDK